MYPQSCKLFNLIIEQCKIYTFYLTLTWNNLLLLKWLYIYNIIKFTINQKNIL